MKRIDVEDVKFDEEIYPRVQMSWQTAYDYSESMKTGAKFPPIVVALFKKQLFVIDGYHRLTAYKTVKVKTIDAEVLIGLNKKQMFEEAIRRNISHGRVLSPYEKRRIALKLRQMKYPLSAVSELIQVPLDKLESFVGQRLISSTTGKTIVKSGLKHLAGMSVSDDNMFRIGETEKGMFSRNQVGLIEQLISLITNGLIDRENEDVDSKLRELKKLI